MKRLIIEIRGSNGKLVRKMINSSIPDSISSYMLELYLIGSVSQLLNATEGAEENQSMSNKQWYMNQWDKYIFDDGTEARNNGKEVGDNPFDLQEEAIDYALWLMGWIHADIHN